MVEFLSRNAKKVEFDPNDYVDIEMDLKRALEPLKAIRNDLEKVFKNMIESNNKGSSNGGTKNE